MSKKLSFFAIMVLAACSQTSEFQRPEPPIPEKWAAATAPNGKSQAASTHWRNFFPDPRLQALIGSALENNRDLRIAVARVEEARALYGITRADRLPNVSLLGSGNFSGISGSPTSKAVDTSLTAVSYELDFWGRLANLTEAARNGFLATEEARRAAQISLVADVASAYFTLLQMQELAAIARSTVELRQQSLALIGKGRDLGATYDFEYQQASGILESTRASLAFLEHQSTLATNRLNYLVGQVPGELPAGRRLDEQGLDTNLAPGLPAEVLLSRPDVMAAEQRLKATHANIDAARAAFFPKIVLTAGLGFASQSLTGLLSGGAWSFLPSLAMPLFDGGRTASGVDLAQARKVIAVAEYEKTIQVAFREVADQLSARASLAGQLRASSANMNAQEKRLQIAQARFNTGLISYLEVLDGQREYLAAQQAFAQVRHAQLESATQLYKALGGGT
ncbi:MAG: efflux transporter outer membrane subunit [Rhodoferax sp.]|jgi:multidrug efflux system outer membrane protein|nr:efflux transporter outer membrane subunit [Rhodoferax sp.]